jgi:hypothetical protein
MYWVVWLIVCDLETSTMRWPRPELGCCATAKKMYIHKAKHIVADCVRLTFSFALFIEVLPVFWLT